MSTIHKIFSKTPDTVDGILYNGKIVNAGDNRNFKTALFFNNESTNIDKPVSYVDVNCNSFRTNELSLSLWVYPKKTSLPNAPIFVNENKNNFTGVFYNCSENEGEIGVMWNEDKNSTPTKTGILVSNTGWIHLVFVFNKTGKVKMFGNGVYLKQIDLGRSLDKVDFSGMKLGGFCGWVDNFNLYTEKLKYGGVNLGQPALQNVSYLFNINRITGDLVTPIDITSEENNEPFYYIQPKKYVDAYKNYKLQKMYNHEYYEEESLYEIDDTTNSGEKRLADGSFRTFLGKIMDKPLKDE